MLSASEIMLHSTARIECIRADGSTSSGTGFYFSFFRTENGSFPSLITNKHVVEDAIESWIHVTLAKGEYEPDYGNHVRIKCQDWLPHPDATVDLVVSPLGAQFKQLKQQDKRALFLSMDNRNLADEAFLSGLTAMEDVVVIGYPNGIWDQVNNLPILRKGITATPPFIDYSGKKEFLVDCAIYPGSSGSPVYLYNHGSYSTKTGGLHVGSRFSLLGIVYAVYQHEVSGKIVIEHIPTATVPIPISKTPNNIGLCIKSSRLLEFEQYFDPSGKFP
jgi:Trypsin-like peptidase domain